ncbi:MAG TPA: aminopeptidase [Chloroflexia bacterium]|nr:aminopeptidase [Chloroflexia bacterium]
MLIDPRVQKMAEVLVHYSLGVQPGWQVCISSTPLAAPLIGAADGEVLKAGGFPVPYLALPELGHLLLAQGSEAQVQYVSPFQKILWEQFDAILIIRAESNTRANMAVPPERIALQQAAVGRYSRGMAWMQQGRPYSSTLFPTAAHAQDANMSLSDYEDFVFHAAMVDGPDPVGEWRKMHDMQQRLVDWLKGKREVHVKSPSIDLTLSIADRIFINSDGHNNFPSGEIYTGPVEDSVNGHIHFAYPAIYQGRAVDDVTLYFKDGRVDRFDAGTGREFLAGMLDSDAGARRLGEFALGTNRGVDRYTRNVLFDEKMAGTIHCALGASYPSTGGTNKSAIHWDMVADMHDGRITVDGEVFYEGGNFLV